MLLPASLVEAKSLAGARCEHAWRAQRPANDWDGFVENLREVVKLSREEAQIRAQAAGTSRYDALLNLYEPGMRSSDLDRIFGDLKTGCRICCSAWWPSRPMSLARCRRGRSMWIPSAS